MQRNIVYLIEIAENMIQKADECSFTRPLLFWSMLLIWLIQSPRNGKASEEVVSSETLSRF